MFESFENFLEQIDDENKDIVITGDLNCNLIEQGRSQATPKLQDIMDIFQLRQHIQTPTRTNVKTSTLIDVILTRIDDGKITNAGVIDLGISDHSLVYVCRKVSIPKEPPKIVYTRQFKNYQINNFKQDLANCINSHVTTNDPNLLWNEFKTKFLTIAEKHAPVRHRRGKSESKPWLTKEIKQLMYHRVYLKGNISASRFLIIMKLTKGSKIG